MKRCAFLTLEDPTGFVIDDDHAVEPFRALGWVVEVVPWSRPGASWALFDAVVIRSTWDYQKDLEGFLGVLGEIERSGTPLFNDLETVRWNLRKTYLLELEKRGVPIVPTLVREVLRREDLEPLLDELEADEIVVKPAVGANADGLFRLARGLPGERWSEAETYYAGRALLAQPLVPAVLDEGEYSLFYFGGVHSHSIVKKPAAGDLRVQEEHGGEIRAFEAGEALLRAGSAVMAALPEPPLYARVDLVRASGGDGFWLMELELVEPSLYLRMDREAPRRFAEAFHARASAGAGRSREAL